MRPEEVIKALGPGTFLHDKVKQYMLDRLEMSERKMSRFYARWAAREREVQAYVELNKYEQMLKNMNETGAAPVAVSLTIPYSYATIATIATYLTHTFTGRKPIFAVGSNNASAADVAQNMETLLQWNCDSRLMVKRLMQYFKDGELYGLCIHKCLWEVEHAKRTVRKQSLLGEEIRVREERVVFEGNDIENVDPFLFFPDPRCQMSEVNRRGEFVFWRSFGSRFDLRRGQADGKYMWVDRVGELPAGNVGMAGMSSGRSNRSLRAEGDSNPGSMKDQTGSLLEFVQLDQGTVDISPAELFEDNQLPSRPEKWIVTIANKTQIIQCEPFEYDHNLHPVCVVEPQSLGYGFGQLSTADYLSPIQEAASWFLNSHMHNVRSVLNNMLVVNPAIVEMKDLASPKPGKLIRLKRSAINADPRMAVHQLQFSDVTRSHVQDLEGLFRMGDMLSSVNDNLRGIQDSGGRKTATEVRTSGEAGASRLAAQAKLYSAMGLSTEAQMMSLNFQQFMTQSYEMNVLGSGKTIQVGPEQIVGDFYFPITDGTLPLDKVALLDVWKEILMFCATNPQMQMTHDVTKIFDWVAELGGARNISSFRRAPPGMMPLNANIAQPGVDPTNDIQAGNSVPIPFPTPQRSLPTAA